MHKNRQKKKKAKRKDNYFLYPHISFLHPITFSKCHSSSSSRKKGFFIWYPPAALLSSGIRLSLLALQSFSQGCIHFRLSNIYSYYLSPFCFCSLMFVPNQFQLIVRFSLSNIQNQCCFIVFCFLHFPNPFRCVFLESLCASVRRVWFRNLGRSNRYLKGV